MPVSEQGPLTGRYMLIPRTLIFLVRDQQLLLIKGAPHKRLWAHLYNGVGGHIEQGEDVLSAARRELLEETGLQVEQLWLCGTLVVDTGESVGICIFILRGDLDGSPASEIRDSTEGKLEWVPLDQLYSLPLVEDLHIMLPRVLGMQAGDPPFSARMVYDESQAVNIFFGV